jgi:hypothetical protein
VLSFPQHPFWTKARREAALEISHKEARYARHKLSDPMYDPRDELLKKSDIAEMIKQASTDHKVRSSVANIGDLAVRVAAAIKDEAQRKKENEIKAFRAQIGNQASSALAKTSASLKESALVSA